MNENTLQADEPIVSEEYTKFLAAVEKNGAYVQRLDKTETGDKKITQWNVNKGAKSHGVTDENLIGFTALTRRQRREIFHKK